MPRGEGSLFDDLDAALQHLQTSTELGEHAGLPQNAYRSRVALARIRQAQGDLASAEDLLDEAERVYATLAPGYPGAEARLRYGLLLKRRGKLPEAQRVLKDLLDGAKLGPGHYRRAQAEWLDRARRELS